MIGVNIKQTLVALNDGNYCNQIIWVSEGRMTVCIENKQILLEKGMGIFVPPNTPIEYFPSDNKPLRTSWFTFTNASHLLEYHKISGYFVFKAPEWAESSLEELHDYAIACISPTLLAAEGFRYLARLLDMIHPSPPERVDEINNYLKKNFFKQLSLDDIAEHFKTDKYSLCRLYKNKTGTTIMNKLKKIRIYQARQLLWQSPMSIEEIARICGYMDTSYFIKSFKEVTGHTPKKYRERVTRTNK